jgi:hypothetical protein
MNALNSLESAAIKKDVLKKQKVHEQVNPQLRAG